MNTEQLKMYVLGMDKIDELASQEGSSLNEESYILDSYL